MALKSPSSFGQSVGRLISANPSQGAGLFAGLLLVLACCVGCKGSDVASGSGAGGEEEARSNFEQVPRKGYSRVVSLTPNMTEMVALLGAEGLLVGRTAFCDYPSSVTSVPMVSGGVEPNVEALLAARPDLVVVQKGVDAKLPVDSLTKAGVSVYVSKVESAADVARTLEELGVILSQPKRGREAAAEVRRALGLGDGASVRDGAPVRDGPQAFQSSPFQRFMPKVFTRQEPSALSQVGPVAWEGSEGEERYPNNLSQMRCRLGTV